MALSMQNIKIIRQITCDTIPVEEVHHFTPRNSEMHLVLLYTE